MAATQELLASERDNTLNPRQLRAAGYVPATLYGPDVEPQCIQIKAHELQQAYLHGAHEFKLSGFVNCTATLKAMQVRPVTQEPLSVQFWEHDAQGKTKKGK